MPAGRPRKPTRLKLLAGNPGKRSLPKGEPQPKVEAPKRPLWIVGRAKAEWDRIVPLLLELRLLAKIHMMALAAYCQAAAELEEATRILNRDGRMLETPALNRAGEPVTDMRDDKLVVVTILKIHPMVKLQRDALGRVNASLAAFGLSPSTLSKVKGIGDSGDQEEDPLVKLMNRNAKKQA